MLKKIAQYLIYGVVALFTVQYIFVSRITPSTVLSDITTCIIKPSECTENTLTAEKRKNLPVLDSITVTETEQERQALLNSFEIDVIDRTNRERINRSLAPLAPQALLSESARVKALDMYRRQYFEHESPDGKGVSDLTKAEGYDFLIVGENLALGDFKTADSVVDAWMNSKGHRENILNEKYREIGVSMVSGTYNGKQALFIVQHFGTNRSICPVINAQLKNTIERTATLLLQDEKEIESLKDIIESETNIFSPEYGKNVTTFNVLIGQYNQLLDESRTLITRYNEEVRAFNACLAEFQ